jgi:hypothetical protein
VELFLKMIAFWRPIVLGLLLIAAGSRVGWAQTSTQAYVGGHLNLNGLTLSITGCTLSYGSLSACSSTDGIFLQGLTVGKHNVSFELVGAGGGSAFSLAQGSGVSAQMVLTYTVTTDMPATATFSNGSLALNGGTSSSSTHHVTVGETFTANGANPAPTGLTGFNLYLASSATSQSAGATSFTNNPGLTTFKITDTINLTSSSSTVVHLDTLIHTFRTAPEPVSLSLFGVGLLGLGAVRRLRRKIA